MVGLMSWLFDSSDVLRLNDRQAQTIGCTKVLNVLLVVDHYMLAW